MALAELEPGSEPFGWATDAIRALKKLPAVSEGLTETEGKSVQGAVTPVPTPGPGAQGPPPQMSGAMAGPAPAMMGPG
jgi:hypothetical protein